MSIGLMLSFLLVITAFEWKTYGPTKLIDLGVPSVEFDPLLDVPITDIPPPPPPQVTPPKIIEIPDDKEIEKKIDFILDTETTEQDVIADLVFKDPPAAEDPDKTHIIVEEQPVPEGGLKTFYQYVRNNMKYPTQARRMGIEGKVFVSFVVEKDGSITELKVLKGIGAGCDEEALRVLANAPKWNPGKQRGKAVKVRMQLPIYFRLD